MATFWPAIFARLASPVANGKAVMRRRSAQDKEYFVQDWMMDCLQPEFNVTLQGRNSHPDFVLTQDSISEGLEAKSLENRRPGARDPSAAPCRTDVDFNSCIPCGRVRVGSRIVRCYYAFVLYESSPHDPLSARGVAIALVDGNFLNRDFGLAASHQNTSESGFGSYGDAFVRTRKMYRFPNPLTIPELRYKSVMVTEDVLTSPLDLGLGHTGQIAKAARNGRSHLFNIYELV